MFLNTPILFEQKPKRQKERLLFHFNLLLLFNISNTSIDMLMNEKAKNVWQIFYLDQLKLQRSQGIRWCIKSLHPKYWSGHARTTPCAYPTVLNLANVFTVINNPIHIKAGAFARWVDFLSRVYSYQCPVCREFSLMAVPRGLYQNKILRSNNIWQCISLIK